MKARAILVCIGLIAVMGAALPAPAAAAVGSFPAESFSWNVPAVGGSTVSGWIEMTGNAPIFHTSVAVDTAPLAGIATLTATGNNGSCPISGTVLTCPEGDKDVGDGGSFWYAELFLTVKPLAGAVNGKVVKVPVTTAADGVAPQTGYLTLTFRSQPILATVFPKASPAAPALGDHVSLAPIVTNAGATAANTVVATFELTHGLSAGSYDNCVYAPYPAGDGEFVRCTVPGPLAPGAIKALAGFSAVVPADAPTTAVARVVIDPGTAAATDPFPGPSVHFTARPPTGSTVTLATSDGGANPPAYDPQRIPADESTMVNISGGLSDLSVAPTVVQAAVGATTNAQIVATNHGPNEISLNPSGGYPVAGVVVRIPTWATAIDVPAGCRAAAADVGDDPPLTHGALPGYPYYYCASAASVLPVNSTATFAFRLRITAATGTDGSARIWRAAPLTDTTNDTGPITLTLVTATSPATPSPGTSSPGGSSDGSSSASASPSTSASPQSSDSSSAAPAPATGADSSHLPKTGSGFGLIALGGVVIVLIGLSLLLIVRLRRD
jgi:LPXTG-motif cell wall-anchored protein